jgi:hypothetical protein
MTAPARYAQTPQERAIYAARLSQPYHRQWAASPLWRWLALMVVAAALLLAGWLVAGALLALARAYLSRLAI